MPAQQRCGEGVGAVGLAPTKSQLPDRLRTAGFAALLLTTLPPPLTLMPLALSCPPGPALPCAACPAGPPATRPHQAARRAPRATLGRERRRSPYACALPHPCARRWEAQESKVNE